MDISFVFSEDLMKKEKNPDLFYVELFLLSIHPRKGFQKIS